MNYLRYSSCALVLTAIIATTPNASANSMVERGKLEKMAEAAKAPKEHIAVSKQYRLQAEEFDRKALKHEAEARRLETAPRSAMAQKWPAMAGQPWIKERQLAMEARRAAKECLEASDRHLRLGVEQLAAHSDDVDQSIRSHADQIGAKRRRAFLV